ncbi:MAG TPA: 30S ribosomal protein S4 [Thermomicrobiales bacterium]|nr:30S ribosomal protein S4 [Thermomicrobiales bacterium]
MARYTGPVCRICRREGVKLFLKGERCLGPKCGVERRRYAPGQHGQRRGRKPSEYGLQLREKQKARRTYGVLERQFHKHFTEAARMPGMTGENLLRVLELRLDNVVYRLGFADSRAQARQLVRHGHFMVNGRKTNIPSFRVRIGQTISVRPQSAGLEYFKIRTEILPTRDVPDWLSMDTATQTARVVNLPSRDQIDTRLSEQLIVEYYSR